MSREGAKISFQTKIILDIMVSNIMRISEGESTLERDAIDLISLTKEEERKIKGIVSAQNGGIRVFIHPFFDMYDLSYASSLDIAKTIKSLSLQNNPYLKAFEDQWEIFEEYLELKQYFQKLHRVLKKSPPLILIGEEDKCIDMTIAICRMLDCLSTILFYQTENGSSSPKEGDFDDIATSLTKLGVVSMLVGGQYVDFEHDMFDNSQKNGVFKMNGYVPYDPVEKVNGIYGCAGNFAFEMASRNFNITISQASFPYSHPSS